MSCTIYKNNFFLTCFKMHNYGYLYPLHYNVRKCYDLMNAKIALTKLEFMILIEHKFREKQAIIRNLVKKNHTVCKQNNAGFSL